MASARACAKGFCPKDGRLDGYLSRILTPERRRVLQVAREEPLGVAQLARCLKRDARAVSRDVDLLEKHKLVLNIGYAKNPGHGFRRIVKPAAAKIRLVVTV